jgi:hypothetical protein
MINQLGTSKLIFKNSWLPMANEGILGCPSVFTKQSFKNRENEKLYKCFSTIIDETELLVSVDRYGKRIINKKRFF